ncbi:MAG TPA: PVC-type heme-binding CxxCH protein [Roseimicrobium sp.]|nr:PVC-type heme-binding CxxCH protein [Roseimicrobium sp.]
MNRRCTPIFLLVPCVSLLLNTSLPSADFKFSEQTLTVPEGFEVELVAPATLIPRPISASFDPQGRLYVTDSAGMSDKADKQLETKPHRLLRLEDTDGDGKFDRSTVFADRLMFPEGCLWYEGSVYVAAPPSIWKFTDADGDGVAEKREEWFQGKTLTGCANDLHGPYLGRDGRIYWTKGAFAEQTYERPGKKPFVTRASHIFRSKPDGTGIEPVLTGGMDNPVGLAFTSNGERFLSSTFLQTPGGGNRDGLIHAIYGGVYGKQNDVLNGHPRTGELMPVLYHAGPAASCGMTAFQSALWGDAFRDNLFACHFNLHKMTRHRLIPDGGTYRSENSDFLVSDSTDFHPTDVIEDADGSLLIIDTGGWYKICCPTSQLAKPDILGAIYRVKKKGSPKLADPRGSKIAWNSMKSPALANLLADPRSAVQERAIQQFSHQGTDAVPALANAVLKNPVPVARRNAVWALARIEAKSARDAVQTALNDTDPSVVIAAAHVVSLWRDAGAAGRLEWMLQDRDAQRARVAAEALGRLGKSKSVSALLSAAATERDRVLEHSLIYALIEIADPMATAQGLKSASPHTRKAALISLDQMENGGLSVGDVTPLLVSKDSVLKQTAAWIVSHRPEWGDALAGFFGERIQSETLTDAERADLTVLLGQLSPAPAIQSLLARVTAEKGGQESVRLTAIRAMGGSGLKAAPVSWLDALAEVLRENRPVLAAEAVASSRALPMPKSGHAGLADALLFTGGRTNLSAAVRLDALATSPGGVPSMDEPTFHFIRTHLAGTEPMLVRNAASTVLAKAKLTPEQQLVLADTLKTTGPLETPRLLPAFERVPTEALGLKLVAALKESPGLRGLRTDLLKPLFAKYPASVAKEGEALLDILNADAAKQAANLDRLGKEIPEGDIRRGQAVFNSTKAACATCHAMGYLGGNLGPDLTRIGQVRTQRDLLEAIVYPSASFVRSYEPMMVNTRGGDDFVGVVKKEASDEVVLAIGPQLEQRIARADIKEMRPGAVSLMPQGLDEVLTRQELSDLITFLRAAK